MDSYIVQDRVRQRWIIFTTCFASFMCMLDAFIVNISLPTIAHTFNAGTTEVACIVIVYLLVLTSTIPVMALCVPAQRASRDSGHFPGAEALSEGLQASRYAAAFFITSDVTTLPVSVPLVLPTA
ncbi:MAG: hypothetical protein AB2L14_10085 [Candidatus Xenobiia bacterium LiM19]